MTEKRKKAYLALLTTAIIWGLAPPIIKYSLFFISPITFLFYRFLIVSVILFVPLIIKLKKLKPSLKDYSKYIFLGFLGTPLTLIVLFFGIQKTAAINASIISIFTPVMIILGGVLFLREKLERNEKLGLALVLGGASLCVLAPLLQTGGELSKSLLGNLLILLGSLAWASFSLLRRKEGEGIDSFVLSSLSFLIGLAVLFPLMVWLKLPLDLNQIPLSALWGVLYMAILGSVVAYFTYIYGFSKIEASEATLFTYLEPIFAIPVAIVFLKETVSPPFLFGALLTAVGVIISELRVKVKKTAIEA
jgi:drug/metabolite transporter (DMT)-like permease